MPWDQLCVAACFAVFWCLCGIPAAIIGVSKNAAARAFLYGVLFGPIGVAMAFTLDGRPRCQSCHAPIEGFEPGFDADSHAGTQLHCSKCGTVNAIRDQFENPTEKTAEVENR